jgi:DNA (cytosine-5)-methyltransferase 1
MNRPRLLDAFCGAGGSSRGYQLAGFHVTGVDNRPQPRFAGDEFVLGDALEYLAVHGREYDAVHASPPCQAYSVANNIHGREDHPDLIEPTRAALQATGLPYVIENVPGAPLLAPMMLCGLSFGLNVRRHRLFESNVFMLAPPCGDHRGDWLLVFGHTVLTRGRVVGKAKGGGNRIQRQHVGTDRGRRAMGIEWMNRDELSEAIPPAYTQFIGEQLTPARVTAQPGRVGSLVAAAAAAADGRHQTHTSPARGRGQHSTERKPHEPRTG